MTYLENLEQLVDDFEKLQDKYSNVGASDTEPDYYFQRLLIQAFNGVPTHPGDNPDDWELYHDHPLASKAAISLKHQAAKCIEHIKSVPIGESREIRKFLKEYCWRIYW